MTTSNITKKEFSTALVNAAEQLLGSQLDGPFSVILYPPGFNFFVQFGQFNYYNEATLDVIDRLCVKDADGVLSLIGSRFSTEYCRVLQNVVYKLSSSDQKKFDDLYREFTTTKIEEVIKAYELVFNQITQTQIDDSKCSPNNKIGYIEYIIKIRFGGDPQKIPTDYAGFRSQYNQWISMGKQLERITTRQLNADQQILEAIKNTSAPSTKNGGWQINESSYGVAYTGLPAVTAITGSLTSIDRKLVVTMKLTKVSAEMYTLSISGDKSFPTTKSVIGIDFNKTTERAASQSLESLSGSASKIEMSIVYPGITILQANPKELSTNFNTGWYSRSILSEIIQKTGQDVTGFHLRGSEFSIDKLFGPGKTFAKVRTFVISQEPTIQLTFFESDMPIVRNSFKLNETLRLDLADSFKFGATSSTYEVQQVKNVDDKIVVTLAPPINRGTVSPNLQTAYIIGGVVEYPPSVFTNPKIPLMSNSPFSLKAEDGRYIGTAEFGDSFNLRARSGGERAYWPMLKGDKVTFQIVNPQQLESGYIVKISTCEQFRSDWQEYNIIGSFLGGCYYWNDYGSKSNWRIAKVDNSSHTQIHFGDTITLLNEHYHQYLTPGDNDYLTTEDTYYIWTIEEG